MRGKEEGDILVKKILGAGAINRGVGVGVTFFGRNNFCPSITY